MSDSRQTLDQRRARHAWNAVKQASNLNKEDEKKTFARETKQLPVRIKTAGLGQALAFLRAKAKDKDARNLLLVQLGDWLLGRRKLEPSPGDSIDQDSLIQAIIKGNAALLRRATEEALLYLQWLTRFSEAKFGTGEDSDQ